jgi:putative membrane protein
MRTTLVATICVFTAGITACAGSHSDADRANNTADTAGAQISAGQVAPSSHNTATALTDANVLGQLAEANQAEIAVGQMALQRTKSGEVRSFARRMVSDHTKMLNAGKAVADSLAVTPSPPSPDSLPQKSDQETQTLSALTGMAFDKAYLDAQVADHRMVLALLGKLAAAAQDPRVQSLIAGAQPTVQQHLDRAQSLDAKVNTTM